MRNQDANGGGYKSNKLYIVWCRTGNYEVEEEEASKENKSPFYISNVTEKGYYQVKDHAVSEGDRNQPKLIQDLAKEGKYTSEVYWLVEDQ